MKRLPAAGASAPVFLPLTAHVRIAACGAGHGRVSAPPGTSVRVPRVSRDFGTGLLSRRFPPDIQRTARRKLLQLHAAVSVRDISVPPNLQSHYDLEQEQERLGKKLEREVKVLAAA